MSEKNKHFVTILENHKAILYKITNSYCKNKSDQQDLIQDIIVQLWQSFDNYDDKYKLSTWIYRIALNTSISHYRKNKSRKEKTIELTPILEHSESKNAGEDEENIKLLQQFIYEMREIDRALILLYLEGLGQKEISGIMGISLSNVSTKIGRIKNILKQKFEIKKGHHEGY